jgi:protocatechuate 3,4-dioxygenase beta subunit
VYKSSRVVFHLEIIIALLGGVLGFGLQRIRAQTPPPGAQSPQTMSESAPTGSISGHVYRADTGAPLTGVVLTLHLTRWSPPVGGPPAPPPATRTGSDGAYTFSSLQPENYTIQIEQRGGFLVPQPPIRRATVAAGQATQNIDFRLQPAAAISGSVDDEYDDPLSGMTAAVFCPDPNLDPRANAYSGYWQTSTQTDDQGNFRASDVPPGRCYVAIAADASFLLGAPLKRAKFYPDAESMEKAQAVEVKPGQEIANLRFRFPLTLSGILGVLKPAQQILPFPSPGPTMGSVSGHVYRADTRQPIAGAILHLNPFRDPDQIQGDAAVPSPLAARTGSDGAYTFAQVEPRQYGVDVERQGFAPLTLNGPAANQPNPGQIFIAAGQHLGNLDYKLQPTGAITGSVRDQDGVPLQGLVVTAFCSRADSLTTDRVEAGRATTDDRGDFRISGIIPGDCDIGAGPAGGPLSSVGYLGVFYPNAATMENAQPIPVKADGNTPDIRLVVRYLPTYTITVKVVENANVGGQHLYSVRLTAARPLVISFGFGAARPVTTNADGSVVLRGVTAGTYNIYVHPLRELTGVPGPTVRRPDGTIDPRGVRENHAWTGGPADGSAAVQVVDRDVCIQIPLSGFPPSPLLASPQAGEKCGQTATETASVSENQRQGCAALPYEGKQPEDQVPPDPDFRGGMLCRYVINPKLPLFTFRFVAEGDNPLGKIEVSEGESTQVIQTIPYSGNPLSGGLPDPLHNILNPVDANFDGYKDLPLLTGCGAVGNCTYEVYLYDPATNRFVYNSFLSGLTMLEFDPQDKTVTSYYHLSAGDGSSATYQYRNGQYVLIEKWESSWDRANGIITKKTYELRDGKMELTKCEGECPEK